MTSAVASSPSDRLSAIRKARSEAADQASGARSAIAIAEAEMARRVRERLELDFRVGVGEANASELRSLDARISKLSDEIARLEPIVADADRKDDFYADKEAIAYREWLAVEQDRVRAEAVAVYADALLGAAMARDALGRLITLSGSCPGPSLGLVPVRALNLCRDLDSWVTHEVERGHAEEKAPSLVIAPSNVEGFPSGYAIARRRK